LNDILSRNSLALPGKYEILVVICMYMCVTRIYIYMYKCVLRHALWLSSFVFPCSDVHCVDIIHCSLQVPYEVAGLATSLVFCSFNLQVLLVRLLPAITKLKVYGLLRLLVSHICFIHVHISMCKLIKPSKSKLKHLAPARHNAIEFTGRQPSTSRYCIP